MEETTTPTLLIDSIDVLDQNGLFTPKAEALLIANIYHSSQREIPDKDLNRVLAQMQKDYLRGQLVFLALNGLAAVRPNGKYPMYSRATEDETTFFINKMKEYFESEQLDS